MPETQKGHFERPPLGEAQHRLDLYEEGSFAGATVVCLGGPDHECRWWCTGDCEQCSPGDHPWQPIAYCRVAEWINACGLDDTYAGDEELLRWNDEGDMQDGIHSGLIETEWTGDDYIWRYPDEGAVDDSGDAAVPSADHQYVVARILAPLPGEVLR